MKKKTVNKLAFKKNVVSNLETSTIKGGVSGRTCEYTNKYYRTCWSIFDLSELCNTFIFCEG